MSSSNPTFRILLVAAFVLLGLGGLVTQLWYIQIARGAEYTARLQKGSQVTVRIPAVRGEIVDRNGIPLVQNRASFDVDFYFPDMVRSFREENGGIPTVEYRATVHGMPKNLEEADIETIVREYIIPKLEELGVAEDYNSRRMQVHYRTNQEVPFNYRQDLEFDDMAVLAERNMELPGVIVTRKPVRHYVYGALAAHLLGYVGDPRNLEDQPDLGDFNFYDPDMEGKAQVELFMDKYLRGKPGTRILQRSAKGIIEGEVGQVAPVQGANVYLTIDARIQAIVEKALRVVGRAAAVVIDPSNGDILAMATVPSYDPNTFIPSISSKDWKQLLDDQTDPLLNRATSPFEPGSTFKIVTALGILDGDEGRRTFNCSGSVTYGNTTMRCMGVHGQETLEDGIKHSCNSYFYQAANAAGIEHLNKIGNLMGIGQKSGIPLSGEDAGILPGPEYLARVRPRERWTSGYTANTAIGQGEVLATPLQMANVAATVANGGTCYYPRLIDKVVAQDGEVLLQEPAKVRSVLTRDADLTPEDIERVRQGMWQVVNEGGGTARRARLKDVEVAGKTGTAQNWAIRDGERVRDNHVWFISFAPYKDPKYAVAVVVQGGRSGGGVAAPIAAEILEKTLQLDKLDEESNEAPAIQVAEQKNDADPAQAEDSETEAEVASAEGEEGNEQKDEEKKLPYTLAALTPAKGNFRFVNSIDFGRPVPAAIGEAETASTSAAETPASQQSSSSARAASPNVRADADQRGRVKNKKPTAIQRFFNFFKGKKKKPE